MSHHTKEKGDLAVLKAMAALGSQGFLILNPLTEHAPFDLVAYKLGLFYRIQVKYATMKNDKLNVSLRSCWADKHGVHTKHADLQQIDFIALYCPDTDECYFVKTELQTYTLRFVAPKNKQSKGIKYAKDHLWIP